MTIEFLKIPKLNLENVYKHSVFFTILKILQFKKK